MSIFSPENLHEKFPHAYFHREYRLITWYPSGHLTNDRADQVIDFLEHAETIEDKPFNRYTDMTGYSRIELGLDHIVRLARRRRGYKGVPVRSAFYAVRLLSLTIANMYEELMCGSRIQVCTFRDRIAAAEWLGVPSTLLQPQKT